MLLGLLLLLAVYRLFFYRRWRSLGRAAFLLHTLFYLYICLVLAVTVMPFRLPFLGGSSPASIRVNFIPFIDVIRHYRRAGFELVLNILMLLPFGFLLPLVSGCRFRGVLAGSALFSFCIELTQFLYLWTPQPIRRPDITDLITNTVGGILGYLLFLLLRPLFKKHRRKPGGT